MPFSGQDEGDLDRMAEMVALLRVRNAMRIVRQAVRKYNRKAEASKWLLLSDDAAAGLLVEVLRESSNGHEGQPPSSF